MANMEGSVVVPATDWNTIPCGITLLGGVNDMDMEDAQAGIPSIYHK